MSTLAFTYSGYIPSSGISETADYVTSLFRETVFRLQDSSVLGMRGLGVLDDLAKVREAYATSDWDNENALPVNNSSVNLANALLESLPIGTSPPSIGADPDGQVSIEWYRSPRRIITISVDPEGKLHYGVLLGQRTAYGTESFFGDTPIEILRWIGLVTDQ